ncbi:4Fe-4S ferredoxin [candidate division KSB1 bacterium]|nr:MAG: 4Fe-4S ferredoxin [candidate division KSB1 bacterium]
MDVVETIVDIPTVIIRVDECKGCGYCVEACPVKVLVQSKKLNIKGYHPAEYKGSGCTGCGVCFYTCPEPGAITVIKK